MPAPVFSVPLWELQGNGVAEIGFSSPPVPAGFVWVVRSMSAVWLQNPPGWRAPQLQVYINGWPSWSTPLASSVAGQVYSSGDMRLVLDAGSELSIPPTAEGWWLRVTGYQLTA